VTTLHPMIRRLLLPVVLLCALAAAPATSHATLFGFSEQQAGMFTNPLYSKLKKAKVARYIAPWDVATDPNPRDRDLFNAWLAGARATKARVLVSFYYDRDKPRKLPTVAQYTKAMKAFKAAYPDVREISPYNEANRDARNEGRFAGPSAKLAAKYYLAARKVFRGARIVGLDVLDGTKINETIRYIKTFQKATRKHPNKIWGVHNYSDTNRFTSHKTKAILRAVKGEVWLTETGGLVKFSKSFPRSETRAAKALKYMFKLAASNKRIKRLYIYQWTGAKRTDNFDAGLVSPDGRTVRKGYAVVKRKLG
jgi:Glycosyl hydrolase catalytic core